MMAPQLSLIYIYNTFYNKIAHLKPNVNRYLEIFCFIQKKGIKGRKINIFVEEKVAIEEESWYNKIDRKKYGSIAYL